MTSVVLFTRDLRVRDHPALSAAAADGPVVPLFVVDPSERLRQEPCPTYLYKDPADIPERFYTRLGLEKPEL